MQLLVTTVYYTYDTFVYKHRVMFTLSKNEIHHEIHLISRGDR